MIRSEAWTYLDNLVSRRKSLELRSMIGGGYCAVINGYNFGTGDSCREAFVAALRDTKKRRKLDAR